jgi:hypothetical protein
MTNTNTQQKAPGACDSKGVHTDTNTSNFASHGPIDQAPDPKAIASQIAHLAIAGHVVHKLARGGYMVCKYGYTHHASDFAALQRFARRLGVSNEL